MTPHEAITAYVVDALKKGTVPWQKPYVSKSGIGPSAPCNGVSGHVYRGSNSLLTQFHSTENQYPYSYYLTYNGVKELGGKIEANAPGVPIVYVTSFDKDVMDEFGNLKVGEDGELETETVTCLRRYTVWNVAQTTLEVEDLPAHQKFLKQGDVSDVFTPIDRAEMAVAAMHDPPEIIHQAGVKPHYNITRDKVVMPTPGEFKSSEGYYSTLFHEFVHSSGHADRLARPGIVRSGNDTTLEGKQYAFEELVAEMGAMFLTNNTSIDTPAINQNSAAYMVGWISSLENNPRWIVTAGAQAATATAYILGQSEDLDHKQSDEIKNDIDEPDETQDLAPVRRALTV